MNEYSAVYLSSQGTMALLQDPSLWVSAYIYLSCVCVWGGGGG